ncbi:MAG: hypothetical protein E7314_00110 [Clostridiales bacterium]|nr:hypothetical protein [Clostridiales bacterium]
MKVFCHGFNQTQNNLISYKGLNTINNVDEIVLYSEKGKVVEVFEKVDCEAVAIFTPTVFAIKKGKRYFWSDVLFNVPNAKTIDGLKNGKNYVKRNGTWMLIEETE